VDLGVRSIGVTAPPACRPAASNDIRSGSLVPPQARGHVEGWGARSRILPPVGEVFFQASLKALVAVATMVVRMGVDTPQRRPSDQTLDAELVDRAVHAKTPAAQAAAFTEIYQRHHAAVLRRCSALLFEHDSVLDAAHDTFEAAFVDLQRGRPPRDPGNLQAWLLGIARHRCLGYMRGTPQGQRRRQPRVELLLHDDAVVEQAVDDDTDESAIRRRQAQVDRLLAVVVMTFDERWQRIYQLSVVEGRRGRHLAEPLGVDAAEASRLAHDVKEKVLDGFGALVLARDGRRFCAALARILDEFAWNGDNFTPALRSRIVQHFDSCRRCDACPVCNERRKPLVIAYQPVLLPPLLAPDLHERVSDTIRRLCATRAARSSNARRRRRQRGVLLLLLLLLLVPAIVVLMQPSLPWTQDRLASSPPASTAAPTTSTPRPAGLADLAGTWRVAPYTLSGDRVYINNGYITTASPSSQTWTIRKVRCVQGGCSYEFLTDLSQVDHPELIALRFLENVRPGARPQGTPLRLEPVAGGFAGTSRSQTQCGQNTPGPGNPGGGPSGPVTETVTYKIRVVDAAPTAGGERATKLEITTTLVQDPSSGARAGGCLPSTSLWRTTATRGR
jgi:RNA polymerase sigma factor (sigma-70 family)